VKRAAVLASLCIAAPAAAQSVALKPVAEVRLRYETVDQADLPRDAHAMTARIRSGLSATRGGWSALVESEAVLAIVGRYNDGLTGPATRPLVADPENIELNRAQLSYTRPGLGTIIAGRQRIELADQRFVGAAPFRQSEQTFDAVRVQWASVPNLSADLTYARASRTINGIQGRGARQTAVTGDNLFALLGYATTIGTLTGFAYLVDQDEAVVQGFRQSTQTYGARLSGRVPLTGLLGATATLAYAGSWARQSDWHRNPNRYAAGYWLGEATVSGEVIGATFGHERLGAAGGRDRGAPLTSFQTPLASLFKFQGWADRFTTTPADGIRDSYATATAGWKARGIALSATIHRFTSDRAVRHYGDELDLLASKRAGRALFAARWARYRADRASVDVDKVWLSVDWTL